MRTADWRFACTRRLSGLMAISTSRASAATRPMTAHRVVLVTKLPLTELRVVQGIPVVAMSRAATSGTPGRRRHVVRVTRHFRAGSRAAIAADRKAGPACRRALLLTHTPRRTREGRLLCRQSRVGITLP
jgi:hypothetical protein